MLIAVTGGRDYQPSTEEEAEFWRLYQELGGTALAHGCCPAPGTPRTDGVPVRMRGVDAWVERQATLHGVPVVHFPPKQISIGWPWCGPERNGRMVRASAALIAFPGGRGTGNTVRQAEEWDRPVRYVSGISLGAAP